MWVEKHGRTWRIRERTRDGKITLADGYPTKKAATDGMTQLRADELRGDALVPRGGKLTLDEWLDLWWPGYETGLKPSAKVSAAGVIRRYIRPMLGRLTLDELDGLTIKAWVADLLAGRTRPRALAPKTVHNAHGQLHKILDDAVAQRLIRSNPCRGTGLPEVDQDEMRFLTEAEAQRLLLAVPEWWRPLVLLLLFTGLRWSEAAGLRVGQVDMDRRRLTVVTQLQEIGGQPELVEVSPKSRRSRRTVTFPGRVALALADLISGRSGDEVVFRAREGGPVRYRQFYRRIWRPSIARAGLDGLRPHDLRHTHAAWLISAGVPMLAISHRLGHASIKVTMDRYGHLLPGVDEGISDALDRTLRKIDDGEIESGGSLGAQDDEQPPEALSNTDEIPGQEGWQAA